MVRSSAAKPLSKNYYQISLFNTKLFNTQASLLYSDFNHSCLNSSFSVAEPFFSGSLHRKAPVNTRIGFCFVFRTLLVYICNYLLKSDIIINDALLCD